MSVRKLELFEDILCGETEDTGNGILYCCTASVTKKDMNPAPDSCLSARAEKNTCGYTISAGHYFLIQDFLPPEVQPFNEAGIPCSQITDAALELWLEFVWQEAEPADQNVFVRIFLHEGEYTDTATGQKKSAGTVFQLLRRIAD